MFTSSIWCYILIAVVVKAQLEHALRLSAQLQWQAQARNAVAEGEVSMCWR